MSDRRAVVPVALREHASRREGVCFGLRAGGQVGGVGAAFAGVGGPEHRCLVEQVVADLGLGEELGAGLTALTVATAWIRWSV
ncbi:hypothetical protein [Actinomadura rudentiformis]|uniref:Uncharacterized protein n=1 Tax=Actinomadura rudentiformis TaxID=359158 RepID=A0A6H9Z2V2_9ACTN|nr:hypothetical protein [Actinomadura rudentiformis]KAB2350053.1 hypothetical protein F8566_09505 [Actinomadura rudentiformis]